MPLMWLHFQLGYGGCAGDESNRCLYICHFGFGLGNSVWAHTGPGRRRSDDFHIGDLGGHTVVAGVERWDNVAVIDTSDHRTQLGFVRHGRLAVAC